MSRFPAWLVRGAMTRLRPFRHLLHRIRIRVANPGVVVSGGGQKISSGVLLRASDGGCIMLGSSCELSRGIEFVAQGGRIEIGARTFVGPWTTVASKAGVLIGSDCLIAERVSIRDQDHSIHGDPDMPIARAGFEMSPIVIGDGAWIGAGAIVLKGVRLGRGAVVAANAVVVRDVAEFEIVGGVPAARIGMRNPE